MLRIDVKTGKVRIVQFGLRNPWRFHFDENGDLYIADVGQNKWEEIDVVAAEDVVGANFGWNLREGKHCYKRSACNRKGLIDPVLEYGHKTGCSVTGGVVYRGKRLPHLRGMYFYSDYCTAILRSFRWSRGKLSQHYDWKDALDPNYRLANVTAFGVDHEGDMYILTNESSIYKLVPAEGR
jgi:glucose/arabinose dehydrogenase